MFVPFRFTGVNNTNVIRRQGPWYLEEVYELHGRGMVSQRTLLETLGLSEQALQDIDEREMDRPASPPCHSLEPGRGMVSRRPLLETLEPST